MSEIRKIIHIDMDAFYASVEVLDNPELEGRSIIVGGLPERRGVVCSASYPARKYGVRSAMPTSKALKLCPHAVVLPPRFDRYREISERLRSLYREYTDLVEPVSLDECYLDVTENKKGILLAGELASKLQERIRTELKLSASAGVAPNKFVAKIASDLRKPGGLVIVAPEKVKEFLEHLPVSRMWGVGEVTERKLFEMGIQKIGDLIRAGEEPLYAKLGKFGRVMYRLALGQDERPVVSTREPKSVSRETTFPKDTDDLVLITEVLKELARDVAGELKKLEKAATTVTLKIKYADFTSATRSKSLGKPTDNPEGIFKTARALMEKTEVGQKKIRLIGVGTSGFPDASGPKQLLLFEGDF